MVLVREVTAGDLEAFRGIRLEALCDAPEAFGSTYRREVAFVEADWQRRIARGGNFLGYLWAAARNAKSVHLWVTETNKPAGLLYERCGFTLTGERQPLPSNPVLGEVAMSRPL